MFATAVTGPLLVWWWAALAVGAVVAVVVVVLLQWLLRVVHQIEEGAEAVWATGQEVARNTATTWILDSTAGVIEDIRDEAGRHEALLRGEG